jgi:hypothetical protein
VADDSVVYIGAEMVARRRGFGTPRPARTFVAILPGGVGAKKEVSIDGRCQRYNGPMSFRGEIS